jgi:lipopolysaccharide assembly outer membrane protein LptD (OstA)
MDNRILWLRICYWVGAIFDGIVVLPMLFPPIAEAIFGIQHFNPGTDYRYAMGVGASLMIGWTILLLWADRKPVKRKDILLLTLFPVVTGLILSGTYAVSSNFVSLEKMLPTFVFQFGAGSFFLVSYLRARDL